MGNRRIYAAAVAAGVAVSVISCSSAIAAKRLNCDEVLALTIIEKQAERKAREDLKGLVQGIAIPYAANLADPEDDVAQLRTLGPQLSRALRNTRARVERHAGNVQRLQAQRDRLGCNDDQPTLQQQQAGQAAAAAAIGIIGFGIGQALSGSHGHSGGFSMGGSRGSGPHMSGGIIRDPPR